MLYNQTPDSKPESPWRKKRSPWQCVVKVLQTWTTLNLFVVGSSCPWSFWRSVRGSFFCALSITLVDLFVSAQVWYYTELTSTAWNFTSEWLLASVTVHMRLKRTWASESLVTDLTLVLLLRWGWNLWVEWSHHGLWRWRKVVWEKTSWSRQCPRVETIEWFRGRTVVCGRRIHRSIIPIVATRRGDGWVWWMRSRETISIGSVSPWAVYVSWSDIVLAHCNHSASTVKCFIECSCWLRKWSMRLFWLLMCEWLAVW